MSDPIAEVIERSRQVRAVAAQMRSRFREVEEWAEAAVATARERREYWRRQRAVMRQRLSPCRQLRDPIKAK